MKTIIDEYFKIIIYTILGIVLILSSYMIIINIHHYRSLSKQVVVSEIDNDYTNYRKKVNDIGEILSKNADNKAYSYLNDTYKVLKDGGVFRLMPKTKLTYRNLYELNDYFMNDIINNCWVLKLKGINKDSVNEKMMTLLINNSKYLNNHFLNNGLTLYDTLSDNLIQDDYDLILKNYDTFVDVVFNIYNSLGG